MKSFATYLLLLTIGVVFVILCFGCNDAHNIQPSAKGEVAYARGLAVYEIDSCEYVVYWGDAIVHKQNCKYCAKRNAIDVPPLWVVNDTIFEIKTTR